MIEGIIILMKLIDNGLVKLFSPLHIIYIVFAIGLFVGTMLLANKFVKKEKTIDIIMYSIAGFLFVFILAQRVSVVYWGIHNNDVRDVFGETRSYNWFMILPDSICALINISLPIALLIKKKDNKYIEGAYAICMLGCITNIVYPTYIEYEPLWQMRSWGGLVHHFVAGWLLTFLLLKGYFTPSLKRWYLCPIILVGVLLYGLFCLFVLRFSECMNIAKPLVEGLIVSYYWGLAIGYLAVNTLFLLVWYLIEKKLKKKTEIQQEEKASE